jgi:hypothetical protein
VRVVDIRAPRTRLPANVRWFVADVHSGRHGSRYGRC